MCGAGAPDARYLWTPPVSGTFAFSTQGSEFDTILTLRSADCQTELACSGSTIGTGAERIVLEVELGEEVIIDIDGDGEFGNYALGIEQIGCPRALLDGPLPFVVTGNTGQDDGLNFIQNACDGEDTAEATYWFTAPSKGLYTITAAGDSDANIALVLRDGKNCEGATRGCRFSDWIGSARAGQTVALEEGQSITIGVESRGASATDFDLQIGLASTCDTVLMDNFGQDYFFELPGLQYGLASCVTSPGATATIGRIPFNSLMGIGLSVELEGEAGFAYFLGDDPCFGTELLCLPYGAQPAPIPTPDVGLQPSGKDVTISVEGTAGFAPPSTATIRYGAFMP